MIVSVEEFENLCEFKIAHIKKVSGDRHLFIFGAGIGGKVFAMLCEKHGCAICGFIDKKAGEISQYCGYAVYDISSIQPNNSYIVVALRGYDREAIEGIRRAGFSDEQIYVIAAGTGINTDDIIYKGCLIGRYTYGYEELLKDFPIAKSIGRYCSINYTARILNNHSLDCITTHPFVDHPMFMDWEKYLERKQLLNSYGKHVSNSFFENSPIRNNKPVTIGNDVWIGANVMILPGVIVGDGAVLAAGAIVNKDVNPYEIVAGNPARMIKKRFSDDVISRLLSIKWWEWDHKRIEENYELFLDTDRFINTFG